MVDLSNINRIVFIAYIPLTEKLYNDFLMSVYLDMRMSVCWCDISRVFKYGGDRSYRNEKIDMKIVNNYRELEMFLIDEKKHNSLFFPLVTCDGRSIKFYKLLTNYNISIAVMGMDMIPTFSYHKSRSPYRKIIYLIQSCLSSEGLKRIKDYLNGILMAKYKEKGFVKGFDVIFRAGIRGVDAIGVLGPHEIDNARIININSSNYELIKKVSALSEKTEKYILFIDQYWTLHPDGIALGLPRYSVEKYYQGINDYFDRIEAKYGLPVKIAAHPKAERYKKEDFFRGREVCFGKTAAMCVNASFVMTHTSTAMAYAIALGIRIHLLSFNELEEKAVYYHEYISSLADVIGCNYQKFDDGSEINVVEKVDEDKYAQYKWNYLTSPETEEIGTVEIIKRAFGG